MGSELSTDIIDRLRQRAQDPILRTEASAFGASARPSDEILAPSGPVGPKTAIYLSGINSPFAGMISNLRTGDGREARDLLGAVRSMLGNDPGLTSLGGEILAMGPKPGAAPAPPPLLTDRIETGEAELGFRLPGELRSFYLSVANGGVGPGSGVYSLELTLAKYREFSGQPIGPQGQSWPLNLLPFHGEEWDVTCIDCISDRIVYWDMEELDMDNDDADSAPWQKSFKIEAESLEAWFTVWLGSPQPAER